jgi:uncharacterized protein (TIGR03435 family)
MRFLRLLALTASVVAAQDTPRRQFEVASIKPNKSGPPKVQSQPLSYSPGGRFTATNVTLVDVIVRVYPTRRIQIKGGPEWIDSERFDIVAKADTADGEVKDDQWPIMVQALLEDRFKLTMHRETKETPVYALVGTPTANLRKAKDEEQTSFTPGENRQLLFRRYPIGGLVNLLSNTLHEPVIDGTGIEGFFDFTLDPGQFAAAPFVDGAPRAGDNFPDLVLAAVREQLGLRLEKRKAPLDITVVDRAEKPTEN